MRPEEEDIGRLFKETLPSARQEEESGKRVFYRLLLARSEGAVIPFPDDDEEGGAPKLRWRPMAIALAAVLASLLVGLLFASGLWRSKSGGPIRSVESVRASSAESQPALVPQPVPPVSPPSPRPAIAAAVAAAPPQDRPVVASQNAPEPDSLLIIGTAYDPAARSGQRSESGNGRPAPLPDDPNRLPSPTAEMERAIEQALRSREAVTDVSFAGQANYFQLNRAEYFVPVDLKIPGTQLAGSENAGRIALDIVGLVTDNYGTVVQNIRDAINVPLSDENAKQLPMRQIAFETGFTLLPGGYSMKFLVYDRNTSRIGTYQMNVDIPNLLKQDKNLPISSVVLSTELINLHEALSNSLRPPGFSLDSQLAADPLFIEGKKLIPRLTRTFSKRRELTVFFQAYESNAAATEPLTAFVTLYSGQTKVLETPPLTVQDDLGRRWKTLPVELRVPLSTLPVGIYDCQVTVTDSVTQKSTEWRSQIEVVD